MTGRLNEALRQIEKALEKYNELSSGEMGFDGVANKALRALASLRSLLEGDAGEDEKILVDLMNMGKDLIFTDPQSTTESGRKIVEMFEMGKPIIRSLSAKAKLGEAEIRGAKREVLEGVLAIVRNGTSTAAIYQQIIKLGEADNG